MKDREGLTADGRVMLASADKIDGAAASLSFAQRLMGESPNGPATADFSALGADVAAEYASFAVELAHLLHEAPGHVFEVAEGLRATARQYVCADAVVGAGLARIGE